MVPILFRPSPLHSLELFPIASPEARNTNSPSSRSIFFTEACAKAGRNANCARLYKTQMETAGFTNVVEKTLIWPTNRWPKDKKMKDIGMWTLENLENGLEALSTALFTRVLGWEKEELDAFLVGVRKEMRDTKFHTYWDM